MKYNCNDPEITAMRAPNPPVSVWGSSPLAVPLRHCSPPKISKTGDKAVLSTLLASTTGQAGLGSRGVTPGASLEPIPKAQPTSQWGQTSQQLRHFQ